MRKSKNQCELTTSPAKRKAAEELTAKVKDDLPPGLSQPALRALAHAGITNMRQLAKASAKELLALHGMGPKGIRIIRETLARDGKDLQP